MPAWEDVSLAVEGTKELQPTVVSASKRVSERRELSCGSRHAPWLAAFVVTSVLSFGPKAQTLEEALVSTYVSNPTLEAQRAALRATDELLPQALAGWRPSLRIESDLQASRIDSALGDSGLETTSNALVLEQNLYEGGATVANVSRAERLVRAERARLVTTEQEVMLDAVTVYSNLLNDLAVLELAKQNESRLRQQLKATEDRLDVGDVTRTDVAQAEARVAGAVADRVRAQGVIRATKAAYLNVIDLKPVALQPPPRLRSLPESEAEAQKLAEALNPSIIAAEASLAAAREDVRLAQAALYPRLDLEGELDYTDEPSTTVDWERTASLSLQLRVPLYQGGGEYASVRQNRQVVDQRRNDLDAVVRSVREEVTRAWQALMTARSSIMSIEEQVRAAAIALEGSRQEALVGQRTTLDVLDQEQDLFDAEVDLVAAQRDEIVASYQVKAAIGQLTAASLDLPIDLYVVESHYDDVRRRWIGLSSRR